MSRRFLGIVILAAAPTVLSGQAQQSTQAAPPAPAVPASAAPTADFVLNQVQVFESSLRAAVVRAARTFATRVREEIPNYAYSDLIFIKDPIVTGAVLPDAGVLFHVQIPPLSLVDRQIMTSLYRQRPSPGSGMTVSTDAPPTARSVMFEPDKEYTNLTRDALFDALLDNALSVPVPDGQALTVMAGELPPDGINPLAQRSRLLILTIKAEDLLALRQQKITREQARERIKESRFGG